MMRLTFFLFLWLALASMGLSGDPIPLKDLDGHFPFSPADSLTLWKSRSEELRKQLLISQGLWPKPTLAPLKPVIHSTQAMDGYSISKAYFESLPGFYVTGTLYQPLDGKPESVKRPGILCPHGHWDNGRFYKASEAEIKKQIAMGAERFESAAQNPMQARCVQLARMGCVVLQYDMVGYADSKQISFDRAHRYGTKDIVNPERTDGKWLLYSPEAEGCMQSTMALQTINSLQAFEFMVSRLNVNPMQIAITGASGGGTQSFIAAAVEPRIAAAMPAVMVSANMQGGCTCENACGLRIGTGNIEIAALIAPRPLSLTAADDWTKNIATDGFPELQKVYGLFDAKKNVELHAATHFPHNYNHVARVALYGFINRVFKLGFSEPILERDFLVQTGSQLTVWDQEHPAPPAGLDFEADLLQAWFKDCKAQLARDPQLAKEALQVLVTPAQSLSRGLKTELQTSGDTLKLTVTNASGSTVGVANFPPGGLERATLTSDPKSTSGWFIGDAYGYEVSEQQPVVKNPRPAAPYTFGYNAPGILRRVSVAVAVLDALKAAGKLAQPILLSGSDDHVLLIELVQKLRPDLVRTDGSRWDPKKVTSIRHPAFLPGAVLYGDQP
jgi:hypothetical protein